MKVVQVKCPSCNSPIFMKQKDKLFFCDKCNVMHTREGGVPEKIDFEIAEFNANSQGERVYMPYWRVYVTVQIHSKAVEGGTMFKLASWLKGGSNGGNMFIYIPASEMDAGTFRRMATMYTGASPNYRTRLNFGNVKRLPAVMSKTEAAELADFVIVTMEAEQPGVLQRLDYTLTVNDSKMVYLPFVQGPGGLAPAL